MGGLKTLAAVVLIKIKIVLVVAAIVALAVVTIKYLLGAAGLPDLPGLLYRGNAPPPGYPPPQYLPVAHEPLYSYGGYNDRLRPARFDGRGAGDCGSASLWVEE